MINEADVQQWLIYAEYPRTLQPGQYRSNRIMLVVDIQG